MSRRLIESQTTTLTLLALFLLVTITFTSAEGFSIRTFPRQQQRNTQNLYLFNRRRLQTLTIMSPSSPSRLDTSSSSSNNLHPMSVLRGGATSAAATSSSDLAESKCPVSKTMAIFGTFWGSLGVVYILAKAIKRVLPIALEPFTGSLILSPLQWV